MKQRTKIAVASVLVIMGMIATSSAQNLVQSLAINLTAYDTASSRTIRIGTPQLIRHLVGSNVVGGRLYLVTQNGNAPGTVGNLNSFLRVTKGSTTLLEISTPDQFNLYQDFAALRTVGSTTTSHALNRFSIDSGSVQWELQGLSTWTISSRIIHGVDVGGSGAFRSAVNGWVSIYNLTQSGAPAHGTIIAGRPRPES